MWGCGGLGFLWMAPFWVGLILLVVSAVRRPADRTITQGGAVRILEERYARGEIDHEDYEQRRRVLESFR